jgi:hypothetical protein
MKTYASNRDRGVRVLRLESLEARNLLSVSIGGGALAAHHLGEAAEIGQHFLSQVGTMGRSAIQHAESETETVLMAKLADPTGIVTASGLARFTSEIEDGQSVTTFSVRITGATPNTTLPVMVDSIVVGQINVDANGNGRLMLSSNPENSHVLPLPTDFPAVLAGSTVSVGSSVIGTLAMPAQKIGGDFD